MILMDIFQNVNSAALGHSDIAKDDVRLLPGNDPDGGVSVIGPENPCDSQLAAVQLALDNIHC